MKDAIIHCLDFETSWCNQRRMRLLMMSGLQRQTFDPYVAADGVLNKKIHEHNGHQEQIQQSWAGPPLQDLPHDLLQHLSQERKHFHPPPFSLQYNHEAYFC